jgi:hypothetical protein
VAGRASGQARPHAHLGAVGGRGWGGEAAGEGDRRRPAAVTAAARGKEARRRGVGQQAGFGASPGPNEATRVAGRRGARAGGASTERRQPWRRVARVARGGVRKCFYRRLEASVDDEA